MRPLAPLGGWAAHRRRRPRFSGPVSQMPPPRAWSRLERLPISRRRTAPSTTCRVLAGPAPRCHVVANRLASRARLVPFHRTLAPRCGLGPAIWRRNKRALPPTTLRQLDLSATAWTRRRAAVLWSWRCRFARWRAAPRWSWNHRSRGRLRSAALGQRSAAPGWRSAAPGRVPEARRVLGQLRRAAGLGGPPPRVCPLRRASSTGPATLRLALPAQCEAPNSRRRLWPARRTVRNRA